MSSDDLEKTKPKKKPQSKLSSLKKASTGKKQPEKRWFANSSDEESEVTHIAISSTKTTQKSKESQQKSIEETGCTKENS
eukprot:UN09758